MPTLYEVSFSTSPQVLLAALLSLVGNSTQFNPCDKLERQGWHQTHRLLQVRSHPSYYLHKSRPLPLHLH